MNKIIIEHVDPVGITLDTFQLTPSKKDMIGLSRVLIRTQEGKLLGYFKVYDDETIEFVNEFINETTTDVSDVSDVSGSYNLDLPMEYEKIRRKIKKWKDRTDVNWVMFKFRCKLIDHGVITTYDTRHLNPLLWDAEGMMKISDERFGNMCDEDFIRLYKKYKRENL